MQSQRSGSRYITFSQAKSTNLVSSTTTSAETTTSTAAAASTTAAEATTAAATTTSAAEPAAAPAEAAATARSTATTTTAKAAAAATAPHRTTTTTAGTAAGRLLDLGRSRRGLGPGQELLEREELLRANEELVAGLERSGLDALGRFYGKVDLVDGAEHLVDLADGCLVLEKDLRIEVGHLGVDGLADHLALAGVHEAAHLEDLVGRAEVALTKTAAACITREREATVSYWVLVRHVELVMYVTSVS